MESVRVCVVDDNADVAAVLCEGLRRNQYAAVSAGTGEEALEVCSKESVDLVLLDVCLPDINGYEVCERLKANEATAEIPVIFCTVKGEEDDIARAYSLGATDYITKPFNLPMVMVRVNAALREKKETEDLVNEDMPGASYTDRVTGLRTRSYLLERLQEEVLKAHRYNYPVSCVVFDVDEITAQDESRGPVPTEELLVELAMTMRNHSRSYDILARYDGTVFSSVLPHCPLEDARVYAQKIMDEVNATTFADLCYPTTVRMCVGIASCQNGSALGAEGIFGEAMQGLLQAKSRSDECIVARQLVAD